MSQFGEVFVFIYYTGHGGIPVNVPQTCIIHKNGDFTNIQKDATYLGKYPNMNVFMILDCCRTKYEFKEAEMLNYEAEPVFGQLYIAFGAQEGKASTASFGKMSTFTRDFIDKVKQNREL